MFASHMNSRQSDQEAAMLAHVDFAYREDLGVLVARTKGELRVAALPLVVKRILEEGQRYDCRLFLLDHRTATIRHRGFADLLQAQPRKPSAFHLPRGFRLAVVQHCVVMQEKMFIEAYINNRGQFRAFEDEPPAMAWLLKIDNPLGFE